MENTDAVPPAHPVPRMPKAAYPGLQRCRTPRVPLTCLARLAAWQSLCTGHVDASLEKPVALWPSPIGTARAEGNRYFRQPCTRTLASLREAARPTRKHGPTRKRLTLDCMRGPARRAMAVDVPTHAAMFGNLHEDAGHAVWAPSRRSCSAPRKRVQASVPAISATTGRLGPGAAGLQ
jgi:hypothetical protein